MLTYTGFVCFYQTSLLSNFSSSVSWYCMRNNIKLVKGHFVHQCYGKKLIIEGNHFTKCMK